MSRNCTRIKNAPRLGTQAIWRAAETGGCAVRDRGIDIGMVTRIAATGASLSTSSFEALSIHGGIKLLTVLPEAECSV
jgi:hypothetical protein